MMTTLEGKLASQLSKDKTLDTPVMEEYLQKFLKHKNFWCHFLELNKNQLGGLIELKKSLKNDTQWPALYLYKFIVPSNESKLRSFNPSSKVGVKPKCAAVGASVWRTRVIGLATIPVSGSPLKISAAATA